MIPWLEETQVLELMNSPSEIQIDAHRRTIDRQRKYLADKNLKKRPTLRLKKGGPEVNESKLHTMTFDSDGKAIQIKRPNIENLNNNPHLTLCTPCPPDVNLKHPADVQQTELSKICSRPVKSKKSQPDSGLTAEEMYDLRIRNYRGPTRNNESQAAGMKEAFSPNVGVRYADRDNEMQGAPYEDKPKAQNKFSRKRYMELIAKQSLRNAHIENLEAQRKKQFSAAGFDKRPEERRIDAAGILVGSPDARE